MIVLRNKAFNDQPKGVLYEGSVQLRDGVDDGIYRTADFLENGINKVGDIHPVVGAAIKKPKKRIVGITNPLKRMIARKRRKRDEKSLGK